MIPEEIITNTIIKYSEKIYDKHNRLWMYQLPVNFAGLMSSVIIRTLQEEGYLHGRERPQEGRSPREV